MTHKTKIYLVIEIETVESLDMLEAMNIEKSIKANAKVWIDESDYVSDGVQELINCELLSMKVITG